MESPESPPAFVDPPRSGGALISVIIPCFNQAHFLARAIQSARSQEGCRVEVIVVDDASTDSTSEVAKNVAGVRCVRQGKNGGLARARNAGLAVASGEFIVFLDADDWLLPSALASGLRCFADDPSAGFVFGSFLYVRADGSEIGERDAVDLGGDAYGALLARNVIAMIATVLFRRDAIEAVGGLDTGLLASEDYDLLLRISREHPVLQHSAVVACYRMHAQNMSRDHALMLRSSLRVLGKQRGHALEREAWSRAYRAGLECWRLYYGKFLFKDVLDQLATRRGSFRAARQLVTLVRHVGIRRPLRWWRNREELASHTKLPY